MPSSITVVKIIGSATDLKVNSNTIKSYFEYLTEAGKKKSTISRNLA